MKPKLYILTVISLFTLSVNICFSANNTEIKDVSAQTEDSKDISNKELKDSINQGLENLLKVLTNKRFDEIEEKIKSRFESLENELKKCREIIQQKNVPSKAAASKNKGLGRWWMRSPLSYDPMPSKGLFHFETSYNFTRLKGNFIQDNHKIKTLIVTRYKRFSYYLRYDFDKRNVSKPAVFGSNPMIDMHRTSDLRTSTMHKIVNDFRFAILKTLFVTPGAIYEEDDWMMIKSRVTYYLGVGGQPYKNKYLNMHLVGAFGKEELKFTKDYHDTIVFLDLVSPEIKPLNYEKGAKRASVFYLMESTNFFITKNISLYNSINYFRDVDDPDRYRWDLYIALNIKVAPYVTFSPNYYEAYDNDPCPLALKRDVSIGSSIKIHF